jgi:hypothetical protein
MGLCFQSKVFSVSAAKAALRGGLSFLPVGVESAGSSPSGCPASQGGLRFRQGDTQAALVAPAFEHFIVRAKGCSAETPHLRAIFVSPDVAIASQKV